MKNKLNKIILSNINTGSAMRHYKYSIKSFDDGDCGYIVKLPNWNGYNRTLTRSILRIVNILLNTYNAVLTVKRDTFIITVYTHTCTGD